MKPIIILSSIYFIGILLFILSGLCAFDWIVWIAIIVGIIAVNYAYINQLKQENKE